MTSALFVPIAEAAFVADLSERQMNRVVDEHLVPQAFIRQEGKSRLFTRLGAAFAKFYFSTEDVLVADARRQVLAELAARVAKLPAKERDLSSAALDKVCWQVKRGPVVVDVAPFIQDALTRAGEVDQADALVSTDPDIMGGVPVYVGTRVPLDVVLSSVERGVALDRLKESYSFLTDAHVQAARVYAKVNPRKGRPPRLSVVNPTLPRRVVRVR